MLNFICTVTYTKKHHEIIHILIDEHGARNADGSKLQSHQYASYNSNRALNRLFSFLFFYYEEAILFDPTITDTLFTLNFYHQNEFLCITSYDINPKGYYQGDADLDKIRSVIRDYPEFIQAFGLTELDMARSGSVTVLAPPLPVETPEFTYVPTCPEPVEEAIPEPAPATEEEQEEPISETEPTVEEPVTITDSSTEPEPEKQAEEPPVPSDEAQAAAKTEAKKAKPPKKARGSAKDIKEEANDSAEIGDAK